MPRVIQIAPDQTMQGLLGYIQGRGIETTRQDNIKQQQQFQVDQTSQAQSVDAMQMVGQAGFQKSQQQRGITAAQGLQQQRQAGYNQRQQAGYQNASDMKNYGVATQVVEQRQFEAGIENRHSLEGQAWYAEQAKIHQDRLRDQDYQTYMDGQQAAAVDPYRVNAGFGKEISKVSNGNPDFFTLQEKKSLSAAQALFDDAQGDKWNLPQRVEVMGMANDELRRVMTGARERQQSMTPVEQAKSTILQGEQIGLAPGAYQALPNKGIVPIESVEQPTSGGAAILNLPQGQQPTPQQAEWQQLYDSSTPDIQNDMRWKALTKEHSDGSIASWDEDSKQYRKLYDAPDAGDNSKARQQRDRDVKEAYARLAKKNAEFGSGVLKPPTKEEVAAEVHKMNEMRDFTEDEEERLRSAPFMEGSEVLFKHIRQRDVSPASIEHHVRKLLSQVHDEYEGGEVPGDVRATINRLLSELDNAR